MSGVVNNAAPNAQHLRWDDIADCPVARRGDCLSRALRMGESDFAFVFYHYLVHEYHHHSNKKRAIFIFERCLRPAGRVDFDNADAGQFDLSINYSDAAAGANFANLKDNITLCKELRGRSWFEKLTTSSAATRPPRWLFDGMTDFVTKHGSQNQAIGQMLRRYEAGGRIESQEQYAAAKRKLPRLKRDVREVGFETDRLGLEEMVLT